MPIACVLVANRGEIAVRIARTVTGLGLRCATLMGPGDEDAPHVDAADVAVAVGSYLDVDAVVAAARRAGADAVHPGYGFLSEHAGFAQAVLDAGLTWIGPPPAAIALMGDKAQAKALARAAGVPVVPGLEGEDLAAGDVRAFAARAGFPVVVKAVAGGGGKGLRVVRDAAALDAALDAARREAQAAFGDGRLLVERYLERPRHIEVQVLADRHGAAVSLGERECSLQRRHQKVVEEAPSPAVDPALREALGAAACALARACGYAGAGTVEFLLDGEDFFFLEMNTRLQVEHPVTELVTGLDLVEQQLRIAEGEPVPAPLPPDGHAVEARLYAEDPAGGFLPAAGRIRHLRWPAGVRVDAGVRAGGEVGTRYDPLLAKIIAHGPDRATALRRLDRALGELELLGVATNAAFTRALLARADVRAGALDTGLLERVLEDAVPAPPDDLLPVAAIGAFLGDTAGSTVPPGPWRRTFAEGGEARVRADEVEAAGRTWSWSARALEDGALRVTLDGVSHRYAVAHDGTTVWAGRDGHVLEAREAVIDRTGAGAQAGALEAPMPGTVLLVPVGDGDAVAEGDVLVVLESMKMELSVLAPAAGVVADLRVAPGDRVTRHEPLVAVVAAEAAR